jgi:hypothetical protein
MEITISIKADNGAIVELSKKIVSLEDTNIIGSIAVKNQHYVLKDGSSAYYLDLCSDLERGHYTKALG